jgi:transcriptional regulator with AAA-type ATPase domain
MAREVAPRTFRLLHGPLGAPGLLNDARRLAHAHFVADSREPDFAATLRHALEDLLAPASHEPPPVTLEPWSTCAPVGREFLRELRAAAEQRGPVYLYGEAGTGRARAAGMLRQWREERIVRGAAGAAPGPRPVSIIRVPSLWERLQDLPAVAAWCLLGHAARTGQPLRRLAPRALEDLLEREWRGNIDELSTVLHQAVERAGRRSLIEAEDLPRDSQPTVHPSLCAKDEGQRECVLRQLRSARTVSAAARMEGCSRANYIRMMRRLGIVRADVGRAEGAASAEWTRSSGRGAGRMPQETMAESGSTQDAGAAVAGRRTHLS